MTSKTLTWEQAETVRLLKGAPGTYYQQANDIEKTIMRDWLRSMLQMQPVTVTFVKNDGSIRDMKCTLDWEQIPTDKRPKDNVPVEKLLETKSSSEPGPHTIRVFDIEKQEWRSFRFDRVQKISIVLQWQ